MMPKSEVEGMEAKVEECQQVLETFGSKLGMGPGKTMRARKLGGNRARLRKMV